MIEVKQLPFGFKWGNTSIQRMASHEGNLLLGIETPSCEIRIRITPSGQIRISQVSGRKTSVRMGESNPPEF